MVILRLLPNQGFQVIDLMECLRRDQNTLLSAANLHDFESSPFDDSLYHSQLLEHPGVGPDRRRETV